MPEDRASVLVVDDEAALAEMYATWLGDEYAVTTATDGETALDAATDGVDVVLLDRRMPGLSGDETLDRLRSDGCTARVAMVTAVAPDFDVVDMPFDSYLIKPVRRDALFSTVEDLLALSSYDDAVRTHFALSEKRAALESAKTRSELVNDDAFSALEASVRRAREAAMAALDGFDHETAAAAFAGLTPTGTGAAADW